MTEPIKPIPDGFHALTPSLVVSDASGAIAYYERAFGAKEVMRMATPDGRLIHAEVKIGDSLLMLVDEFPEWGGCGSPTSLGGSSTSLHLYVVDADAVFDRAIAAGATVKMPMNDAFWGDRYGMLVDPYGHLWSVATHQEDVSHEETRRRGEAMFAKSHC